MISQWVFWLSLATLFYVYAGFSVLVALWGTLRNRTVRRGDVTPAITLIVAAYNEERNIAQKITNALALDYPPNLLEILVGSDGSSDRTAEIAAGFAARGVRVSAYPRRGKIHVLNDLVQAARGDVLVFSDANTLFDPQALRMLARNFADPQVGGVCGNQMYDKRDKSDTSGAGERLYWQYDKWLKSLQTRTGSIVAADGAIYAIRRALYRKPPTAAMTDDFAISTAVIEQGYRLVFDAEALAYESETGVAQREFNRKVRIMVRGLRGVMMRRALLNPFRYGFYSVILLSHKLLRRCAPIFLVGMLASSLVAAQDSGLLLVAAIGQIAFYGMAALGYFMRFRKLGHRKIFLAPFYYCLANGAALVALLKLLRGTRIERWEPQRADM